jgi:hypothetical protein
MPRVETSKCPHIVLEPEAINMKKTLANLAIATAFAVPASAHSELFVLSATMNAGQEVQTPSVVSPAIGSFQAVYDDATNKFVYISIAGQGLLGDTISGLHIHGIGPLGGPPGSNSGIALGLDNMAVTTVGDAFFFNTTDKGGLPGVDDATTFNQTEEGHLLAGRSYINLHTSLYPSGEIRGQIAAVPEPETYALMLAGLGLVGWVTARRRTKIV